MVTLVSGKAVWMGEKEKERQREKMAERKGKEEEKAEKGGFLEDQKVFFSFFLLHCTARRILVPRPGTEPMPPPVHAWILNE